MRTQTHPFQTVAAQIRDAISDGNPAPGQPLPTEHELADTYDVGRSTIRRALDVLVDEGLIDRHQGRRARVREAPLVRIHGDGADWQRHRAAGRPGFDATVAELGITPRQEILDVTDDTSGPTGVAVALGLDPDDRVVMRYVRQFENEVPTRLVRSWFPASWAAGTPLADRRLIRGGVAAYIEDHLGTVLDDSEVEVGARRLTPPERTLLGLGSEAIAIDVLRTFVDERQQPVFVQEEVADAARNRYRFRVPLRSMR